MEQYQQTEAYKLFTKKKLEGKRKLEMGDDAENQINGAGGEVRCPTQFRPGGGGVTKKKVEGEHKLEMGDDAEIIGAGGEIQCYLFGRDLFFYWKQASKCSTNCIFLCTKGHNCFPQLPSKF